MKKCPFCAESIQDEAVVCRWCNRELSPARPSSTAGRRSRSRTLMAIGGALTAIGPFIPWVSVPFLGSLNLFSLFAASDGSQGFAWVPVVLGGAVAVGAAASEVGGISRIFAGICGLLIGLLAVPFAVALANEVGRSAGLADLGLGSWATAVGAVLMFVGSVIRTRPLAAAGPTPAPRLLPEGVTEKPPAASEHRTVHHDRQEPERPAVVEGVATTAPSSVQRPLARRLLRKSVAIPVLLVVLVVAGFSLWRVLGTEEASVDTVAPGWATLAVTSDDDERPQVEVPLVWTDQARVCWDIRGDLEKFEVSIFGNEVSEGFETLSAGNDCRYFSPTISHAAAVDCATVAAFHEGDVEWQLVVQQEKGETYGLSGINTTYQFSLLENPCTGEPFDVPAGFVDCDDGTYAKSEADCTWAERLFEEPYEPAGYPGWTCYPETGECVHENGGFVPEGPQEVGSYCDQSGCYLDY